MTSLVHVALKLLFWQNDNNKGTRKDKGTRETNKQTNKNVQARNIQEEESHRALLSTSVNLPPSVVVDWLSLFLLLVFFTHARSHAAATTTATTAATALDRTIIGACSAAYTHIRCVYLCLCVCLQHIQTTYTHTHTHTHTHIYTPGPPAKVVISL